MTSRMLRELVLSLLVLADAISVSVRRSQPSRLRHRQTIAAASSSQDLLLQGGASVHRHCAAGPDIADFLLSGASNPSLLNAVAYNERGPNQYTCKMPSLEMFALHVTPELTVAIQRSQSELAIRVTDAQVHVTVPGRARQTLSGVKICSCNTVTWAAAANGGTRLGSELTLQLEVPRPRFLPMPRAGIETTASAVLRRVCEVQCNAFLGDIEAGYMEWRAQPRRPLPPNGSVNVSEEQRWECASDDFGRGCTSHAQLTI